MRTEEGKTWASEKMKGEKNIVYKLTPQQLKEQSPFSIDFYLKRFPKDSLEENKQKLRDAIDNANKDKLLPNQIEYWAKKGFNAEDSKIKVSERQRTFSLDICIEKYGKEEGEKRFSDRQTKWQKIWKEKYNNGDFNTHTFEGHQSIIAKEFFVHLIERGHLIEFNCFLNKEYTRNFKELGKTFAFDFVHKSSKVIIEFQGDFWHGNPKIFERDNILPYNKKTYSEIWDNDLIKKNAIESCGYKVIYVWESDYIKDPNNEINKCLNFINEN